jgi:hypothetical protein
MFLGTILYHWGVCQIWQIWKKKLGSLENISLVWETLGKFGNEGFPDVASGHCIGAFGGVVFASSLGSVYFCFAL